ncbi:hypothetical protein BCL80_104292 [Streptomyces avidinii]|nr:hypothetical protein BCL80_104292 [Streptomyces avidinii]SNX76151.1 hypothetical protein SAMN05421860_102333 [Streptomyces microflavus]
MSTSAPPDSRTAAGPEGTAEGLPGPGPVRRPAGLR